MSAEGVKYVRHAPARPILVFDAECNFCKYWAKRWKNLSAHGGECIALQDAEVHVRFPEISRKELERAVHLIDEDGRIYLGAEAVFRFRAKNPKRRFLLDLYIHSRIFAAISGWIYSLVSHNRTFFSWIWGTHA